MTGAQFYLLLASAFLAPCLKESVRFAMFAFYMVCAIFMTVVK